MSAPPGKTGDIEVNPKDKINKLIQAELQKWEDYDKKMEDFRAHQISRFKPLQSLLKEIVASIEKEYIKADILENRATIEISNNDSTADRISWIIEPNLITQGMKEEYWKSNLWQNKINLAVAPGFKLKERQGEDRELLLELGTVDEVIHHLAHNIAKRVAFYRHNKNL